MQKYILINNYSKITSFWTLIVRKYYAIYSTSNLTLKLSFSSDCINYVRRFFNEAKRRPYSRNKKRGDAYLNDVRRNAEERAQRQNSTPVGSSFESDRQREKRAMIRQIDSLDGSNIRKIAAASETREENRILRVAAYCRVSTDDIDQAISIALQIKQYKEKIKANPNWQYVGTYVDDGFSGTSTEHRQGFQKLMQDAMDGKIDMIITKAVSRFARNLMDCMGWVEALQNHDPPIRVFFEQENLDTLAQTSGIILFVLAMVAEEESHMKSEAILLSLEWRFSRGRFLTPRMFGFDKVEVPDAFGGKRKILQINPEEARVVRWMYYTLVGGSSPEEIASILTELEIPTGGRRKDGSLNTTWSGSGVVSHLRNEKYCGDVLARKYYTQSYKTHKKKKNNGKKNKYFQADHHEGIVTRAIWNAAQRILNSRKYGHESDYLPLQIIDHGTLAGFISMNRSWAGFDFEDYYHASQIAMGLLDEKLDADLEKEYLPEAGHRLGGLMDDHGITRIARDLSVAEQQIKDELDGITAPDASALEKEGAVKTFQVVSGEMFSRVMEPMIRISTDSIAFSTTCISKMDAEFAELLFNPVERMLIVRPCDNNHPNAYPWDAKSRGATALAKILYDSMDWDPEYSYRVPCQAISKPEGLKGSSNTVLLFDLDNYVGRAVNKKDEMIIARKEEELLQAQREDAKSYYYPPDEDEEPQEIKDLEERFLKAVEVNKRIFGTPAFQHNSNSRAFDSQAEGSSWDMLIPARPLDINHKIDSSTIDNLLLEIMENPPKLPTVPGVLNQSEIIDI